MKIWMVIPAYNEAQLLEKVLLEVKKNPVKILVIDDGSSDATYLVAGKVADIVIKNEENRGKGMSLRKAIDYLLEKENFDYIVTMDADGQHLASDIENFLKEAESKENFVVGNRMDNPLHMPKVRVLTNKFMSWFISRVAKQKIPDTQCGFRLISRNVLKTVQFKTKKFEVESEILIKAARAGFVIKSIPIQSIYSKNQKSRIHPFVDTIRFIRFILSLDNKKK
ncbi:MAG: glycosyltransferase family 2 protein [Candidatus Omnitrophota bacterium]|jgi:glycosyltransferase involved in cell wall biosynthesis